MEMGILSTIVIGILAGAIASWLNKEDNSLVINLILGIVGAFIGSWVFSLFGGSGATGFNFYSLIVATVGAALVLWIVKAIRGRV